MVNTERSLTNRPASFFLTLRAVVLAALGGLSVTASMAQENSPYYIGVSQRFTNDNNITRAAKGSEKSDTISSTGLRAGFDQPFGQQRASASADVDLNRYASNGRLNNTSYSLSGLLDWATIENISGSLSLNSRQSLNTLNLSAVDAASLVANTQRQSSYGFTVQKGNVTFLTLDAGLNGTSVSNSAVQSQSGDLRSNTFTAGVRVQPSPILSVRLGARTTRARYVNLNDEVRRNDIDLSGIYELSGLSRLNARLSYTDESRAIAASRNLKGFTGSLGFNWKPTGKLGFDAQLARDTNLGSANLTSLTSTFTSSDTQVRDSLTLSGTWELTAFVNLNASLGYTRRTLDSSSSIAATGFTDNTTRVSLGATYTPLRNLVLGCGLVAENRSVASSTSTTATFAFVDTAINCYGQAYLR